MKINKMWLDGKPNQNPNGSTRANRNIILNRSLGAIINEKGNLLVDSWGENKRPIGVILLDRNDFIVFVKKADNHSEIGYVDSNLNYQSLSVDARWDFSYDRPIHGVFQRNTNGDVIVAFTDGKYFRYFNKDEGIDFNNIEVFSDAHRPNLTTALTEGGKLPAGAYYIILSYEKSDKSVTSWIKDYNPAYITTAEIYNSPIAVDRREGTIPNITTSKSIRLDLSNLDTRYDKLRIGVITQINNVRTAFYVKSISITGTNNYATISNLDEATPLGAAGNLDEVLIDTLKFKTVKNLTQLQNILYIQELQRYEEPIQQGWVNNMEFNWDSQLFEPKQVPNFTDHKYNNQVRHWMHGEVYAVYIRFEYEWGFGQWWHSPGRSAFAGDKDSSIPGYFKFQTHDTCLIDGTLSYWENLDEEYPDKGYYPSGRVRHIKMPSVKWMKENIYSGEPLYGSGKLDILNLKIKQGTFDINNIVDCEGRKAISFQIGYAKRERTTGLIAGQTIFVAGSDRVSTPENIYSSMGFNANHENVGNENRYVADLSKVRTYDYESLFDKSIPNINYVKSELVLESTLTINSFRQPGFDYNNIRWGISDYTLKPSITTTIQDPIKVNKARFIINNTILENIDNRYLEDTIALELEGSLNIPNLPIVQTATWATYTVYTHLITLLALKRNCYSEFFNQQIIVCDESFNQNLFGGDTYINVSNINTFGTTTQPGYSSDPQQSDDNNTPYNGTRIANLFISENRFNMDFRFVNAGVEGNTYHHPHDPAEIYLPRMRRDREANMINAAYNTDYNAQNNLEFSNVFNPNTDRIFLDKFDLRRSSAISNTNGLGEWLSFKLNDVYPLVRTRGEVVNLVAGKDFLIIHHKNALFRTRHRATIATDAQDAYVGQGDIFENEPEEIIYDDKGALGTQHKWSCYMSQYGYFWIDSEAKKIYKYDGQITVFSTNGLTNFFKENLQCNNDNPFTSFGFHTVVDELNKRLLITKKHFNLLPDYKKKFKGIWKNEEKFLSSLNSGDIVMKDGKYLVVN